MKEYDSTNTIAIFRNDKGDNPARPDYRCVIDIDGTEYEASVWLKESKSGTKYMQGPVKLKEDKPASKPAKKQVEEESDLPF